ncbi:preprotein translocase subunit SecF [Marmoricola sp. OAE513]|uniref:protein translocase subunit SecF n=1 Tax=Marmoricola sp. OAE513 TaxID=2817894 RepID=UPI001AE58773
MGKFSRLGNELYSGHRSIDFVTKRAPWYLATAVIVGACVAIIAIKGLAFGIEFTGGTQYRIEKLETVPDSQARADDVRQDIIDLNIEEAGLPTVTTAGSSVLVVELESVSNEDGQRIIDVIQKDTGASVGDISESDIGASWGREVAQRAGLGVAVFLLLVVLFIWMYFREWKMSVAAFVALAHDITITIGIYALSGFPVTPAAVTGLLAILGFSMYDTVVVFDKIRENTRQLSQSRLSYAQATNLAVNQTLVRSINTSIVALIPIGSILAVSAIKLGESSLQDLALAQFVGMAVGVYSSVFLAPRVLVHLKSLEPEVQAGDRRALARARRDVDRYANVPAFTEDMPISADPDGGDEPGDGDDGVGSGERAQFRAPIARPTASGSGRVVPDPKAPVSQSGSANRPQPSKQPRSKRGK